MADPDHTLRLGCVRYLNTLPLIEGLHKTAGLSLRPAPPSDLAAMLQGAEVDAALLSIIDSQRIPGGVTLLPVGVIASHAATMSVRLFSADPLDKIREVHADAESHTAAALLRIVLACAHAVSPAITPFDANEARSPSAARPRAMLLIGDKAIHAAPPPDDYPHTLDLGEAWRALTGMPFVYACWACLSRNEDSPKVRRAVEILDRQRRHNATRIGWIADAHAAAHAWPALLARRYLGQALRFDAGPPRGDARASIERFYDECAAEGLIARRPTRWLDEIEAPCPA